MKKKIIISIQLICLILMFLCGCTTPYTPMPIVEVVKEESTTENNKEAVISSNKTNKEINKEFSLDLIPEFSSEPSVIINNNKPYFTNEEKEMGKNSFISLSDLDELGRCGAAFASLSKDTLAIEERGQIGSVKPSGWHTVKYDGIDGNYLYNRCHLLMYALTGLNAEPRNLITGTRYLNIEGNLPYEESVVDYIKNTGNHVLYRVTPIFENDNLICSGELMEAYSIEDNGYFQFCVYCYNVQPGITIDYLTGNSSGPEFIGNKIPTSSGEINVADSKYILNVNSKKIHLSSCESINKISDNNKKEYNGNISDLLNKGYTKCKTCNP